MSISPEEYRDLLSYFSDVSSARHIISLALTAPMNDSLTGDSIFTSDNYPSILVINNTSGGDASLTTTTTTTAAAPSPSPSPTTMTIDIRNGSNHYIQNASGSVIPRISSEMPIWLIPCYSIIFLFAIVGNLLVISTLVQNRRMRTITNVFLLNLAISDMLLGVLCMPVTLVGTLLRHFIFGEFLCKLIQFSQAASVAVSSWTLVAISCERYYAICHPLRSRTWQTINHAYKIIGFIWFGSILCMTPIAIFSQLMPTSRQGLRKCREHWPDYAIGYERTYNILLDLCLLVLPLLILTVAYILITRTLYVGMKNERAMIFGGTSSNKVSTQVEAVATVTTTLMPSSSFNFNMSFRCSRKNKGIKGNAGNNTNNNPDTEVVVYHQEQQQQQQQQPLEPSEQKKKRKHKKNKHGQPMDSFDEISQSGSKRKLLTTASDGRRHLYCMRSASVKSLNRNNNTAGPQTVGGGGAAAAVPANAVVVVGGSGSGSGGLGGNTSANSSTAMKTSPSPSMTVINMPQQQRFQLHQQRQHQQATPTTSMKMTDAALRRSNETKNLESKRRVVKMLFVLVLEFFICWTPLYVINTMAMFLGPAMYEYIDYTSISFLQLLAYSSSCCNPITYCFMNAGFRRAFLDTFKGLHLSGGRFWRKRTKTETNLSVAGNSIALGNSATMYTNNSMLDSPRL